MKNLLLASTLITGGLLQGCIISSGDDDVDDGAEVRFSLVCPSGAATYVVTGLDGPEEDENCGTDMSILVDPGSYNVTVTPYDGDVRYPGYSESITVSDGDFVTIDPVLSAGTMGVTWTIDDLQPDVDSCADLDAGGVSAIATIAGTAEAYEDVYDCEAGQGESLPMVLDDYVVVVALLNSADESIADSSEIEVSLIEDGDFADLGNINFVP